MSRNMGQTDAETLKRIDRALEGCVGWSRTGTNAGLVSDVSKNDAEPAADEVLAVMGEILGRRPTRSSGGWSRALNRWKIEVVW